jgi:hypothetical protein
VIYHEDLREGEVLAIWVGNVRDEDELITYLGAPFENDFGFLLDDDESAPEFTYSFESRRNPPDLNNPARRRACTIPFDREVDVRKLMDAFSHSGAWVEDAVRQCHAQGVTSTTVAVAIANLRYRPELCRNAQAPLRFIGNVRWPEGRQLWEESQQKRLIRPPFPKLIRCSYGEGSESFNWRGVVHLDSWKGFATPAELSPEGSGPLRGWLLDGDFRLTVEPSTAAVRGPTQEQAATFQYLLDHEQAIRDTVLKGIFDVYPKWRDGHNFPELMPEIVSPEDLRSLIRPGGIYVMANPKDGQTRIGFSFSCRWDEEHGLGVLTHAGRVIDISSTDVAFAEEATD